MRVLALVTDGFGASGGIARYNQALLSTLVQLDGITRIVVVPRFGQTRRSELPKDLHQVAPSGGRVGYVGRVLHVLARSPGFDLVFCGHINMAALAATVAALIRRPWWLQIHGIDAWDPPGRITRAAVARADLVTAVSHYTRERFLAWAELDPERVQVLPNTVDPRFTPGPKPDHLLDRYGLHNRRMLLTVGRVSHHDRAKGQDRVIRALPSLRSEFPNLAYVIAGDGDDRPRLENLTRDLHVADLVHFVGHVAEEQLVEHYRMADVFVMPSTKEGFGIVFLEAMACGIPAIGCDVDGSTDALGGMPLGRAVPPCQIGKAIAEALNGGRPDTGGDEALARFGPAAFEQRLAAVVRHLMAPPVKRGAALTAVRDAE